jgi:trehalose-6-phosphatase
MKGQHSTHHKNLEPSPHVLQVLNELTNDKSNTVFVISNHTKSQMHKWYAEACPLLGLAAENGFFWRPDSLDKNEHKWIKPLKITDL